VLSLIPGTSRSGSTILGGMLCGMSRPAASQFTFFLAIPVMAGASLLKLVKFFGKGNSFTLDQTVVLIRWLCGCLYRFHHRHPLPDIYVSATPSPRSAFTASRSALLFW